MKTLRVDVSADGGLVLPPDALKELGLEQGGPVVVQIVDREVRVLALEDALDRAQAMAQAMLAGKPGLTVDEFLAEKRKGVFG